jgi:hypothetical protein
MYGYLKNYSMSMYPSKFNYIKGDLNMKKGNKILIVVASTGLLSLMSFAAIADSSTSATLEQMIQAKAEKQLAAEGRKYSRIVALAGNMQGELTTRENEAASAYKKWHDLKSVVVSHYPSSNDFKDIEIAAKAYSQANKAFVDLQKNILAQKVAPLDPIAINSLISSAPTAAGMK